MATNLRWNNLSPDERHRAATNLKRDKWRCRLGCMLFATQLILGINVGLTIEPLAQLLQHLLNTNIMATNLKWNNLSPDERHRAATNLKWGKWRCRLGCMLFATHTTRHQCWVNDRAVSPTYCNIYTSALSRLKLSSLAFCLLLREPCLKVND